jgi:hypothetical protein
VKVFYAMPFTGATFATLVKSRGALARDCSTHGLELVEQFVGHEEERLFEEHGYYPSYVAAKDFALIQQADVVIADFSSPSIGRDCEIVAACERYRKPVIAIVPSPMQQEHPWIRLYSRNIVGTPAEAFETAARLSTWLSAPASTVDHELGRVAASSVESLVGLLPDELARRWRVLFNGEFAALVALIGRAGAASPACSLEQRVRSMFPQRRWSVVDSTAVLDDTVPDAALTLLCMPKTTQEGRIWSEPHRALRWSLHELVQRAADHRQFLLSCFDRLLTSQELLYATDSLAPEENELVVADLLAARPSARLEPARAVGVQRLRQWGHIDCADVSKNVWRQHPSSNNPSGGLFVAHFRKVEL